MYVCLNFQMYKAQSPKASGTPKAVHYFQHFPSNFLRPYGLADSGPSEETIFRRVAPLNCEWLLRPRVAASEFADTITQNLNYLSENNNEIIQKESFKQIKNNLTPFLASLQRLNTQTDNGPAKPSDIKQMMKTLLSDNEDMDAFFDNMVKIGGAVFLLGTHYSVVKTLFSNPEWYAEKAVGTSKEVGEFKEDPTIKGLKRFLTATCCTSNKEETASTSQQRKNPAKRNLAALVDSSPDEEEIPPPKKNKKSKEKHQEQVEKPPREPQSTSKKNKRKHQK